MKPTVDSTNLAWRYKVLLFLTACLGAGAGIGLALVLPPTYQSTAQIFVAKKRPDAVAGFDTRQPATDESVAPTQELLKSPLILDNAIRCGKLAALPTFANENGPLSEALAKKLSVTAVKPPVGTAPSVFKLSFSGGEAEDCAVVLGAVLDSFKDFVDKRYQSVSTDTFDLLVREKETLRRELDEKETAYRHFRAKSSFLSKGGDGAVSRQERFASLQAKASALLLRRLEYEGQVAALDAALHKGGNRDAALALLLEFSSDEHERPVDKRAALQDRLFPLLLEESKLLEAHGPKHPDVIAVRRRIEAARLFFLLPPTSWNGNEADEAGALKTRGVSDPIALHVLLLKEKCRYIEAAEAKLAKAIHAEQDEAKRLAALEFEDESFRTSIAFSKQMHETLIKRLNEASLLRNAGGHEVEAIEPPTLARKVAPSMRLFAVAGLALGLLLGLGLAYASEQRRRAPQESRPAALNGSIHRMDAGAVPGMALHSSTAAVSASSP